MLRQAPFHPVGSFSPLFLPSFFLAGTVLLNRLIFRGFSEGENIPMGMSLAPITEQEARSL